jgi:hypothetical protein
MDHNFPFLDVVNALSTRDSELILIAMDLPFEVRIAEALTELTGPSNPFIRAIPCVTELVSFLVESSVPTI